MGFFEDRIKPLVRSAVQSSVIGYCVSAGLKVTNWRIQGVGNQTLQSVVDAIFAFGAVVPTYVRGFAALDLSTDPGDPDDFDADNEARPPERGFLSVYGENTYGTTREEASFASGFGTFTNVGPGARVLSPGGLIFTWTEGTPPSPAPTYTNADDPVLYFGGTLTVPAGTSVVIPVSAQIEGASSSAPSGVLTLTTTLAGCSFTNDNPITGNDREPAETFRVRCRQAPARLSFAGPADAYRFLAAKNLDGTPLLNDGAPPVPSGITRVQVTESSSTGIVNAYFASASGPAIPDDVTAANTNIQINAFAAPDAITYTGIAAISTTVHVAGTGKIRARAGVTRQVVAEAIVAALGEYFQVLEIGGLDQVAGAGVVYTVDLQRIAGSGYSGLYDVVLSFPAGATTAIAVGHIPVLQSVAGDGNGSGDWIVTLVP